ncbi:MAG: UDP-glucose:(heptosyl)LPS alpha-1,3-glucosyltransferase [Paracoccaceae bacterium]|jgi:UDP-glucose:(heptosyl)LPS alpha-1,3-glucosyltransferase
MHLGFALFKYFPFGGLQRDMLAIARVCVDRGYRVTIFCGAWEGERPNFLDIGVLPVSGLSNHRRDAVFAASVPAAASAAGIDRLVGFNKMPGLDFYYAADSCFAAKVAEERSRYYGLTPRARQFMRMERAIFAPKAKTEILLISEPECEVYKRYYSTEPQRMHLLPPGIRRDRIMPPDYAARRTSFRQAQGWRDEDTIVLFVGSGFRTKGLDRALHAFAALCKSKHSQKHEFYVLGHDKAPPFAALAKGLNINEQVHFLGGVDHVVDYLWSADVLLHPAYRENTGTVLLEAMVAGLPVVTTEACGYAHYVRDAQMGEVLPQPFEQAKLNQALCNVLLAPPEPWREKARQFAGSSDIFSMPERAADLVLQALTSMEN